MILNHFLRGAALALCLHAGLASAAPLMDLRAEDLLPMASTLRASLALNPNQLLLWQQSEARSRTLLRERQARRERLQKGAAGLAARDKAEMRELGMAAEKEAAASAQEDAQLRAIWLTMNDALDDQQRGTVLRFLADQLARVRDAAPASASSPSRPGADGAQARARQPASP